METCVTKDCSLSPASFDDRSISRLTSPQKELIKFIKEKADNGEIITRASLLDFYITKVKGSETYKVYKEIPHPNPAYKWTVRDINDFKEKRWRDEYGIQGVANQWFKNNLGSCILKGKLLAIPIIDI